MINEKRFVVSYSGGKDSTAMLIHLLENNRQIDDILYVKVGDWIWDCAEEHNRQVEKKLGVNITTIDVSDEIKKGFERWGFPSILNRWCTGIKRDTMRNYIQNKYGERYGIVQYIGYCSDEYKRTNKKLYTYYDAEYPLVDANITTNDALQMCKEYGFDFGGVYEHHSHFNCWLCPLQRVNELEYLYNHEPQLWSRLNKMQQQTDGYYQNGKSIFDFEKKFWIRQHDKLRDERMKARKKYNKRRNEV